MNEEEERHALDQVGQGHEDEGSGEEPVASHRRRLTAGRFVGFATVSLR
jgi:hypothetical protein